MCVEKNVKFKIESKSVIKNVRPIDFIRIGTNVVLEKIAIFIETTVFPLYRVYYVFWSE